MRTFVVNEIVASETPERSKRESNAQQSKIEPLIGGKKTSAARKINEIEPLIGTKTYIFQKSASTMLWCFTGYHFNAHKSRHCSESTPFQTFDEKTLHRDTCADRSDGKRNILAKFATPVILEARIPTRFPTLRWSAALMR